MVRSAPKKPKRSPAKPLAAPPSHQPPPPSQHQTPIPPVDTPSLQPLPAAVIYASSEEIAFPASELSSPNLGSLRGWVSEKLCTYPQEIVLRFDGEVELNQLQILAHECKIPSRVEVLVASMVDPNDPPSFQHAHYKRLGFLSFISNERTKYRSREKKTVGLSATAYFLKLVLYKCHMNALNNYNQVGLIQVSCSGALLQAANVHYPVQPPAPSQLPPIRRSPTRMAGPPPKSPEMAANDTMDRNRVHFNDPSQQGHLPPVQQGGRPWGHGMPGDPYQQPTPPPHGRAQHNPHTHPHESPPGGYPANTYAPQPPPSQQHQQPYRSTPMQQFENWYVDKTRHLVGRKGQAVDEEDYDVARVCKEQLAKVQRLAGQIYEFEATKVQAIYDENFDDAKAAKARMDRALEKAYALPDPDQALRQEEEKYPRRRRESKDSDVVDTTGMPPYSSPSQQEAVDRGGGGAGGGGGQGVPTSTKHAFEEQPVQSKYAVQMAERAKAKQAKAAGKTGKKGQSADDDGEEEPEEDGDDDVEAEEVEEADEEVEEAPEDDGDEERAETPPPQPTKKAKSPARQPKEKHRGGQDDGAPAEHRPKADAFDLDSFEEWERAVYFAIQDELGTTEETASDTPVDPRDAAEHRDTGDFKATLGYFCTCCLLSRRWKHREAALKVLSNLTGHLYKHQPTANVVAILLKYMDLKGFGLMDPILVCFLASCEIVTKLVEGRFPDCPLASVQTHILHLLPRLLLRSGDSTQRSREEALALLLGAAKSPIGAERVGQMVLADPVDADKRKLPPQNHRVQLSRLLVLQHIVQEHHHVTKGTHLTVDSIMTKLLVPALNHSNNELRELAISVISTFDGDGQQEAARYLHLVSNPSTRAAVDEKLALPPPERANDSEGEPVPSKRQHGGRSSRAAGGEH